MKFYKLKEVPIQHDDRVFRASTIGAGISFTGSAAITLALLLGGIHGVVGMDLPLFVFYLGAAVAVLFSWLIFRSFRASLQPSNWLLRCHRRGVIIQFRSYLNWRFPADGVQAVGFDFS